MRGRQTLAVYRESGDSPPLAAAAPDPAAKTWAPGGARDSVKKASEVLPDSNRAPERGRYHLIRTELFR